MRNHKILFSFIQGAGVGMIALAVVGFLIFYGPIASQEISYWLTGPKQSSDIAKAQSTFDIQNQASEWGVDSYFSLVIPKIAASANIIPNVDPGNRHEYSEALKQGVAHAKGTYFPGQGRKIFLFAHSTDSLVNVGRHNAVFYLLRKLEKGDEIIVFFADKKYTYEIKERVIADIGETSWLTDPADSETLILQTCEPPGTNWKRLLLIAEPV